MSNPSEDAQNGIVVRKNEDGTLDEILMYSRGEVVFHLESMGSNGWWSGLYPPNGDAWHLNFGPGRVIASQQCADGEEIEGRDEGE